VSRRNALRATRHTNVSGADVHRALFDPIAIDKWSVPEGMTCQVDEFDAREGGSFRISLNYDNPLATHWPHRTIGRMSANESLARKRRRLRDGEVIGWSLLRL